MKTITYIALWILLLIFSISVSAQPSDYDDYYKTMATQTDENNYSKLMNYQKIDPYFANIYVQLGAISNRLLHKTDPLKDYSNAIYWANTGILYLQLYTHYVKENEARSNRSYYINLSIEKKESKLTNIDILNFVETSRKQIESYRDSIILVYKNLEKSKENYNACIDFYHRINNKHNNLNETLLKCDFTLFKELNQLKSNFDSTLFYFDRYKELIQVFPIKGYNQQYILKPIKTFRLDGLTNSNFLENSFQIWNFGLWVDEFNMVYDNEIHKLRQEIDSIDNCFKIFETKAINRTIDQTEALKPIYDEKFLFRLGKYDNNSLVRDLFNYKSQKQQFLSHWLDAQNTTNDSIKGILMRKARYYASLVEAKTEADSALFELKSNISIQKINRFSTFFHSYEYDKGLTRYCEQQKDTLNLYLNKSFENLGSYIKFDAQIPKTQFILYSKDTIPLYKTTETYKGTFRTSNFGKTPNNSMYITGQEVAKGNTAPFVAYVDKTGKTKWLKKMEKPTKYNPEHSFVDAKVFPNSSGCFVVYTLKNPTLINSMVRYDSIGNEISRINVPISSFPVFFEFDDINQKYLMAFKGQDTSQRNQVEPLTVCSLDSAGNISWSSSFELSGSLANIIKTDNNYLVFANYMVCNISGKTVAADPSGNKWGSVIVSINETGTLKNFFTINKNQSFHVSNILKLSSNSICLIGFKNAPSDIVGSLFFSLMQPNGKVVFTN